MRSLRARLLGVAGAGALVTLAALIAGFNVVLDGRLGADVDNLLRERAASGLRNLTVLDGRLQAPETPDNSAPDTETWIFAGARAIEQPVTDPRNEAAAVALAGRAPGFATVSATATRLYAVPVSAGASRLGTVVVAASLRPYESSAETALIASLVFGLLTALGVVGASWWLVRRALAPVAEMTARAAHWSEHESWERRFYAGPASDELTMLAATFDRLLERIAQSLRREQRFTAEISHELRTPLARIVAQSELAAARERTPEQYHGALASIRTAALELESCLDSLLLVSRQEAGAAPRVVEPRPIADHVADTLMQQADLPELVLEVTGGEGAVQVAAEPELIERALAPVVDNALRFARRRVGVSVRIDDGSLCFAVSDDGPGVPESALERIFEPGVTGIGEVADGSSGAGLGLPLARRLARAAGGEVRCLPVAQGARFELCFPLA